MGRTRGLLHLRLVFPRGFYGVRVLWADIHKWGGLALGVGALIHVLLHWKWLVRKTRRYLGLVSRHKPEPSTGRADVTGAQPELN